MRKKTVAFFLAFLLAIMLLSIMTACGTNEPNEAPSEDECGELAYALSADGASYTVSGIGTAKGKHVTIASEYNGKPVTAIGSSAFKGCRGVLTITIPDSVTEIGASAFASCTALQTIQIPKGVTVIERNTFSSCDELLSVELPEGLREIGASAFYGCYALEMVTIPTSVMRIGKAAFAHCSALSSVAIPAGVTRIEDETFYCTDPVSVVIPASVTEIGAGALWTGGRLVTITVEEGNPRYHSAGNCLIETESKTLLMGCTTSVIPSDGSVMSIGECAFYYSDVASVTIPQCVTSIGRDAFCFCGRLTSITIPSQVMDIGKGAFAYCFGLASITVEEGNPRYHSAGNCLIETESQTLLAGCKTSVIPTDGSVTKIGWKAFDYCPHLTSITIPAEVTSIDAWAFSSCEYLTLVSFEGTMAQWNAISKHEAWKTGAGFREIRCIDGTVNPEQAQAK